MKKNNPVVRLEQALLKIKDTQAAAVFTNLCSSSARQEAEASQERHRQNKTLSPLDGRLIAVKANFDLFNHKTTAGSIAFQPDAASADAELVQKLRKAGAVILGHTNMSEFAFSGLGLNPHFGTPPNPLSKNSPLVPGGSSSGSASAVAMRLADMALGSDTSGSVRVPAAFQGLVGFRPSIGRYSAAGVLPLAESLDTPGTLCKSIEDVILMDTVLAEQKTESQVRDLKHVSFIAPTRTFFQDADAAIRTGFERMIAFLTDQGLSIERRDLPVLQKTQSLFAQHGTLVAAEARKIIAQYVDLENEKIDVRVRKRLTAAKTMSEEDVTQLYQAHESYQKELAAELQDKFFLMPTTPNMTPRLTDVANHDDFADANARTLRYTMLGAFLNMPTVAMPIQPDIPASSLSISAQNGLDEDVLAVADLMDHLFSGKAYS